MERAVANAIVREAETVFNVASQFAPAERAAYLDRVCAGQPEVRARVEALLRAQEKFGQFLPDRPTSHPTDLAEGQRIGRYKLLEKIGEGGCGIVYLAEQQEPVRRRVALKVIKLGMDTKAVIARFEAERQALAMMDHPNIARVLDGGATETGRLYLVMELVRGIPITKYCDENHLSADERIKLFILVCQAIQHAHQKGIIHRDIKPSNILVTLHDGLPVPRVIDFGIAKATEGRLTEATLHTQLLQFLGTPAYMSPEQAELRPDRVGDIDTRSDIYSLGVLLYELLTGQTPFDSRELIACGIDEMRRIIRDQEPTRPSRLPTPNPLETDARSKLSTHHSSLSTDLDWVVMKCLEKERSRRYESASGLAADLKRFLADEPVLARPPSAAYRFQKTVRRNKLAFAAAAAIATVLVLGVIISTWQAVRATRAQRKALEAQQNETKQRALADQALARAQVHERLSHHLRYSSEMSLAFEALKSDNFAWARELLGKHQPPDHSKVEPSEDEVDPRGWEWRHLWRQTRGDQHLALSGHSNYILGAVFLNDGKTIASAGDDNTLRLWDVERRTNTRTFHLPHGGRHFLSLSPDGRWLALGGEPSQLFDTARWVPVPVGTNSVNAETFDFSDDSQRLAFVSDGAVQVVDLASGKLLRRIWRSGDQPEDADQIGLAFSQNGQRIAYSNPDRTVRLFNLVDEAELVIRPARPVLSVVFSRDGRFLVTGGKGGIEVWDSVTGEIFERPPGHHDEVTRVTISSDGAFLATASVDQTVRIWEAASWKELKTLRGHAMSITSVAFSVDGRRLVSGGRDEQVRVWDLRDLTRRGDTFVSSDNAPLNWPFAKGDQVALIHGNLPYAPASIGVPDHVREALRLQGDHGAISYLNLVTLDDSRRETTPPSFSSAQVMAFGFDAKSVAVGWADHIEFWMTQPFRKVRAFAESTNPPIHLAVSADGKRLSIHRADDTVEIWNPVTGTLERRLPVLGNLFGGPNCEFWAHDTILARFNHSWNQPPPLVELWSLPEGRRRVFPHPKGGLWTQAVSNDGRRLATSGWDGVLRLWDVEREQQIDKFSGQLKTYYSLVFSPDDSRLVGGGYDGTITMWDVSTRQQVARWKAHDRECAWLRFVGPNQDLISLGNLNNADRYQGEIRLWRAPSLSEIDGQRDNL